VVVLAHCHLNVNTKVHGLADYPGARSDVVLPLLKRGVGLIQLPCPEATFLGMKRWGMTREQYDTPAYRRHCETILAPVVDLLLVLVEDACKVEAIIGVDGSPSCGVDRTCVGYCGGEVAALFESGASPHATDAKMPGVFIEVLQALLHEADLCIPFRGVDEVEPDPSSKK